MEVTWCPGARPPMHVLLLLTAMAIAPDVPAVARDPDATTVFHCTFDDAADADFDGWPDEWTRRQGPGFPNYVKIRIGDESPQAGSRCLRIELDGGAAVAYGPPVEAGPLFGYVLEGYVKTEGLQHDQAFLSMTFLDQHKNPLETHRSRRVSESNGWQKLRLGPIWHE